MDFTPQQQEFLKSFLDPKSETFGNLTQSGIKAGYSPDYAENLNSFMPDWYKKGVEKYRGERFIRKAERNLDLALEGLLDDPEKGSKQLQYKASEFALKTLAKDTYSERTELTGKDGKDLPTPIIQLPKTE